MENIKNLKKTLLGFLLGILTVSVLFAENQEEQENPFRLNINLGMNLGLENLEYRGVEFDSSIFNFSAAFELGYITETNLIAGMQMNFALATSTHDEEIEGNVYSCDFNGTSCQFGPFVGKVFGRNKNIQILFFPILIEPVNYSEYEIYRDDNTFYKDEKERDFARYKSAVRFDFQFGSGQVRHGFFIGSNFIWHSSGDFKKSKGMDLMAGYKLSLVPTLL